MAKFFNKFKKLIFGLFSETFEQKLQNLEKTNDSIPRKRPDWWKDRRIEGRTDPIS